MGKLSQQLGKTGQEAALWFLKATVKAEDVHELATKVARTKDGSIRYVKGTPCDFICLIPFKDTSLNRNEWLPSYIEVKLHDGDKLDHSVLESNQINDLVSWHKHGQWSFVLWVHIQECIMFKYPTIHFEYGKSIDLKTARKIAWIKN